MSFTPYEEKMIKRLRMFLRDSGELNKLIEGDESSDSQLLMALEDSLDDWNNTPPPLSHIKQLEKHPSRRLLIRGAAIEVLSSAGILQSRNRLNYSDGGVTVSVSDKAGDYQAWITNLVNDYERKKLELKKAINIGLGWGGVASDYYDNGRSEDV